MRAVHLLGRVIIFVVSFLNIFPALLLLQEVAVFYTFALKTSLVELGVRFDHGLLGLAVHGRHYLGVEV